MTRAGCIDRAVRGVAVLFAWSAAACSGAFDTTHSPVLMIGVDGVEWDVLLPLVQTGQAPNLRALMERGAFGELRSFRPTESPVIWTSVATGKTDLEHGIHSFSYDLDGQKRLYSSTHRQKPALWNILSARDYTVASVGWWMTFPVEPVNGVMVAQTNTEEQLKTMRARKVWKGSLRRGMPQQVFPTEREDEILAVLDEVEASLPAITEEVFGAFPHAHGRLGERLWGNCEWSLRADTTYARVARDLVEQNGPFDLTMVYFGCPDVVGHQFWRYMEPELYEARPTDEELANYGRVIPDAYRYVDRLIGELVHAFPADTTVMILSDHGMAACNFEAAFSFEEQRESFASGGHLDAPPGVLIVAGPGVAAVPQAARIDSLVRADLPDLGSVFDIAPTTLALLRIPPGADMRGDVMTNWMTPAEVASIARLGRIATHDPVFTPIAGALPLDPAAEQERIEQLKTLGYMAGDD